MEQQIFNLERTDRPEELRDIVSKLVGMAAIGHIYLTLGGEQHPYRYRLIIVLEGLGPDIDKEQITRNIQACFECYQGYFYEFFTASDLGCPGGTNSTFFVNHCTGENLIFSRFNCPNPHPLKSEDLIKTLEISAHYFKSGLRHIRFIQRGAKELMDQGNNDLAGYMMYQALEIGYMLAEHFLMGETFIGPSIREHQRFIGKVHRGFGNMIPDVCEGENALLYLVDKAHVEGRFSLDNGIDWEDLLEINGALDLLYLELEEVISCELDLCQRIIDGKGRTDLEDSPPTKSDDQGQKMKTNGRGKLEQLKGSAREKLSVLQPTGFPKGKFRASTITFDGYLDLFDTLEALINVCLLANLGSQDPPSHIPEPEKDIAITLRLANQLLPYCEGRFLDEVYQLIGDKE